MEYIIELIAEDQEGNYLEGQFPCCKVSRGVDEYDALTSFVREYISDIDEENLKFNIHLSRVRPTGESDDKLVNVKKNFTDEEELSDHIASILKTFGFRIAKKNGKYIVRIPSFYITDAIIEFFDYRQVYELDSLDLILLWNYNIKEWTSEKDREYYGIKDDDILVFLGELDAEKEDNVLNTLKAHGITTYSFNVGGNYNAVAVPAEQINMVQPVVPYLCDNLLIHDYNLFKYFNVIVN